MTTGRTVSKFFKFQIEDSGGVMRDIPVLTIGGVGVSYDEVDVSALQDAFKKFFSGQGTVSLTLTGPLDNTAAQAASGTGAAPALSGSHTVLQPLNGALTPRSFGAYFGIQAYWSTGDPVFGGIDSIIVTDYQVTDNGQSYSAKIAVAGNAVNLPAWGTAAITAS
jgi:hypothetical protein